VHRSPGSAERGRLPWSSAFAAVAEAREMVRRGEIVDMKTVVGLGLIEPEHACRSRRAFSA
jgi:hypothetical protein